MSQHATPQLWEKAYGPVKGSVNGEMGMRETNCVRPLVKREKD